MCLSIDIESSGLFSGGGGGGAGKRSGEVWVGLEARKSRASYMHGLKHAVAG